MPINIHIQGENAAHALEELFGLTEGLRATNAPEEAVGPKEGPQADAPVEKPATKPKARKKAEAPVEVKAEAPETVEQDEADETAETEAEEAPLLTHDDVRAALGKYLKKFGMDAAQEDGPACLEKLFGPGKNKVSSIPDTQEALQAAIDAALDMVEKNPFKRKAV